MKNYGYYMTNKEYDLYLKEYKNNFVSYSSLEEYVEGIERNKIYSDFFYKMVDGLKNINFNYHNEYNGVIRYILNIKEDMFIYKTEAKQRLLRKLINNKDIDSIFYILSSNNFYNVEEAKKNILKLLTEEMITKLIFLMKNKYVKNELSNFILFDLRSIIENIISSNNFNKFHKTLLYKEFKKDKENLDDIFLERHNNQQEIYKMEANDEIVLNFFEFN